MAEHQDAIEAIEAQKQRAFEKQQRAQRKYYIKNHPEITNETTLSNKYDNEIIKEITKDKAIKLYKQAQAQAEAQAEAQAPKQRKKRQEHVPNIPITPIALIAPTTAINNNIITEHLQQQKEAHRIANRKYYLNKCDNVVKYSSRSVKDNTDDEIYQRIRNNDILNRAKYYSKETHIPLKYVPYDFITDDKSYNKWLLQHQQTAIPLLPLI